MHGMSVSFRQPAYPAIRIIVLLILSLFQTRVFGADNVLFLYDDRSAAQRNFALQTSRELHILRASLGTSILSTSTATEPEHQAELAKAGLIVAAGGNAADFVSRQQVRAALLYTLLPHARFQKLGLDKRPCPQHNCALLAIEQPLSRQIKIIRQAFGKGLTIGTITGKYSRSKQAEFSSACQAHDLECIIMDIDDAALLPTLNKILPRSDIFLAIPDPTVINPMSARTLLLASYQRRVPVVAFSRAFARAGALLAIYTSLDDMAIQAASIIDEYYAGNRQFQRSYYPPNHFSVETNPTVARSLNIQLNNLPSSSMPEP
jgi:ABC-type uncharacterized transport system substrate-binding protein